MKIVITLLLIFAFSFFGSAQVGINNTNPQAILDITAGITPSNQDGILIPRVNEYPTGMTAAQDGMLVFITGLGTPSKGFYFYNNGVGWTPIIGASGASNTLDESYDEGGAGAGRIIVADNGALDIQSSGGLRVEGDIMAAENIVHDGDVDTFMTLTPDRIRFDAGGQNYIDIEHSTAEITFNENNAQHDFRVESDNESHMLFVDGSTDRIGINRNNPFSTLHVDGNMDGNGSAVLVNAGDTQDGIEINLSGSTSSAIDNVDGLYVVHDVDFTGSGARPSGLTITMNGSTSATNSSVRGLDISLNGPSNYLGNVYGSYILDLSTADNTFYGYFVSAGSSGINSAYGSYNAIGGSGTGATYGTYNFLSGLGTGTKYGSYNTIGSTAGGTHYGVFSDVRKTNSYAGFFIGRTSFGTDGVLNRYIMPGTDGTAGQVITTDGSGQLSFSTLTSGDTDWTVTGNDQYAANTGNVGIGDNTPDYKLDLEYAGNLDRAFNIDFQNTAGTGIAQGLNVTAQSNSTGFVWGANVELINTNSSSESIGIRSTNTSGANNKYGVSGSAIGSGNQNIGILGRATLATANYGGYFTADLGGNINYGIVAIAEGGILANWAGYFGDTSPGSGNVFVNDNLRVDGQLRIDPTGTGYSFPTADGINGQVLTTDGSGTVSFSTISSSDDQTIDTFSFNSGTNIVSLEIEDDGVPLQTIDLSSLDDEDADWLTTAGSNIPTSNNDDIYTSGNVSIGSTTNLGNLNIIHNEASDGLIDYVVYNSVSNSGDDDKTIIHNSFGSAQAGDNTAIYNLLIGNGGGTYKGLHNYSYASVTGDIYGMYNTFTATGNGDHYGSRNYLNGTGNGFKFGTYNLIATTAGGTHYGIYSDVQKASGYAGYFIGRMSLGNGATNRYVMPAADGTAGQVITTNGAGALSWATSSGENSTASNGLTETGDDIRLGGTLTQNTTITNGNFDLEITSTGTATEALTITKTDNTASSNLALDITKTTNGSGFGTAVNVTMNGTGTGSLYSYSANITNSGSGTKVAYNNVFSGSGTGTLYANRNQFLGTGSGTKYGVHNTFGNSAISTKYGVYNDFDSDSGSHYGMNNNITGASNNAAFGVSNTLSGTGTGAKTGFSNNFSGANGNVNIYVGLDNSFTDTGNGDRWGVRNALNGTGSGDKYGTSNIIDSGAGGTHYGTYNDVIPANGWAGYFLGKNYVSQAIGINNPTPDGRLDIIHNSTGASSPHIMLTAQNANAGTRIVFDNAVETNNNWVLFARADDAVNGGTFNIFSSEAGTNVIRLDSDGKMGVMRDPGSNALEVQGDASKTTAGSWLANSDRRLKTNISSIAGTTALEKIEKMRGVTYNWNDNQTGTKRPEGLQYGFIAQELKEIFPEKVSMDNLGFYQTAYGDYDPLFVEAIKELKNKLETLFEENTALKIELAHYKDLEARLTALEHKTISNSKSQETPNKK